MSAIWAIATNTFRENRRDRILYVLLLFAAGMIFGGILLSELSPYERTKILLDMGQAMMSLAGSMIAVFLGISLVSREIERRTIYGLIPKPVSRTEFLLGKVLGLGLTLTAAMAVMAAALYAVAALYGAHPGASLLESIFLLWLEDLLLIALAVAFASFTTTTLAAMFTIACWIIGQVAGDLKSVADKTESAAAHAFLRALYWVVPDLSLFDAKSQATYGIPLPASQLLPVVLYGVCYTAALLALASLVFSRRDFK